MVKPVPFYLDTTGKPALYVDGVEVLSQFPVRRIGFELTAGEQLPRLFIEVAAGGGIIEGEAIVHQTGEERDQRELVRMFLNNIDASILEGAALSRGGMLEGAGDETMGQSFLAALKEMVGGD